MVHRCKHGLIEGQCSICRKEAARAEAVKAYLEAKKAGAGEALGSKK